MKKYSVMFNAYASVSVKVEAESPEEALQLAHEEADMYQGEIYDWDYENPGEICDEDDKYWTIKPGDELEEQK